MELHDFRITERPASSTHERAKYDARPERVTARKNYRTSEPGIASEKKRRHDRSMHTTNTKYLSKRFIAVDGEGVNRADGTHDYILLAISDVPPLIDKNGLNSKQILDYLWEHLSADNINIIYGGSYDFNFWIKSLNPEQVERLYKSNYTSDPIQYDGYFLRWIRGKGFEIGREGERTIRVNDVISFFQRPFIQACDEYLGEYGGRDVLVREKARRGQFTPEEIENVAAYNNLELDLLERLATELRSRLNKVDLRPRRWDGPGAIAGSLFLREGIKKHRNENIPEPVAHAARVAYAGGRFELIKYGNVTGRPYSEKTSTNRNPATKFQNVVKDTAVYEYDINSAYPAALTNVPSLQNGEWIHHEHDTGKQYNFALYRVSYTGTRNDVPGPLFHRASNGTVSYPLNVTTWIWSPETEALREYCRQVDGARYRIHEIWEYRERTAIRPFAFINPLYQRRSELKELGDGAHVGIKLALNSCYGKLAQQVGWIPATTRNPVRVPTYHQLEWAGYVTSWCRAQVLRAALQNLESVIAFETDALFTSEPLDLPISSNLGEWGLIEFSSLVYVQSGHYYATKIDGETVTKCRGIDRGFVSRANVETSLSKPAHERILEAQLTRFYGAGISLVRGLEKYWCKWITEPKHLTLMPTGKRIHAGCECDDTAGLERDKWHNTICPVYGGESSAYPVEWINPDPHMTELTEMREAEHDYESE